VTARDFGHTRARHYVQVDCRDGLHGVSRWLMADS
jgi:hypothetical protein